MILKDKIALITGGTKGIGAATAIALAQSGADVAINGRYDDEEAKSVKEAILGLGHRCEVIVADCGKPAEATRCVTETKDRLGGVDVLVHSAGGLVAGGLFDLTPEAWNAAFDVHVHAIFHLCRASIPLMKPKKEGSIILVSSAAGKLGVLGNVAYQAVKGTLPQLTRALAREFAADNIRINCVAPGVIRTRFHENMSEAQYRLNLDHRIPLKREGTSEQVASLILEMVKNDYITGETFSIDGGFREVTPGLETSFLRADC